MSSNRSRIVNNAIENNIHGGSYNNMNNNNNSNNFNKSHQNNNVSTYSYEKIVFYENEQKKIIKKDLFNTTAEEIAKNWKKQPPETSETQVRKFFEECKGYLYKIGTDEEKWKENEAEIMMIRSKVTYSRTRGLVNDSFKKFFDELLCNRVKSAEEFKFFVKLFESIYGFFYTKKK